MIWPLELSDFQNYGWSYSNLFILWLCLELILTAHFDLVVYFPHSMFLYQHALGEGPMLLNSLARKNFQQGKATRVVL